jgi:leucyl aminopeptidase
LPRRWRTRRTRSPIPVWRLPFHAPYEKLIEPGIADLDNAPKGGFRGLHHRRALPAPFRRRGPRYAHFDIYAWSASDAPGRPKGGLGQGSRAILETLPKVLNL